MSDAPVVEQLATPDPATTPWVPLWALNGGIDLRYWGDYAPGSYTDGDVVVSGGVAYICVRPTSAAPTPWPATGVSIPPVVNGQWLKGVGGAAVWTPITAADVPGVNGMRVYGPYQVTGASVSPGGAQGSVNYSHNLGVAPTLVLWEVSDGSWSHLLGHRVQHTDPNVIQFFYNNPSSSAAAAYPTYKFLIFV